MSDINALIEGLSEKTTKTLLKNIVRENPNLAKEIREYIDLTTRKQS